MRVQQLRSARGKERHKSKVWSTIGGLLERPVRICARLLLEPIFGKQPASNIPNTQ